MKIGVMIGADNPESGLNDVIDLAKKAEELGLDSVWLANIFSYDAISTMALIGRETNSIHLGTAVTPTYPRHPVAMAQQALTTAAASNNRFTLGIGLSHKLVIEDMFGLSYSKPIRHMKEYLGVLMPLLRGESADFDGQEYSVRGVQFNVPEAKEVPVVIAALGPQMLKLAADMVDGTNTWMVGPNTMEQHILKTFEDAGKSNPTIVAGLPIVMTNNIDAAKESIAKNLTVYGQLPSYRAMLDREGVEGPADLALVVMKIICLVKSNDLLTWASLISTLQSWVWKKERMTGLSNSLLHSRPKSLEVQIDTFDLYSQHL